MTWRLACINFGVEGIRTLDPAAGTFDPNQLQRYDSGDVHEDLARGNEHLGHREEIRNQSPGRHARAR